MDEQKNKISDYFGSPTHHCWQWMDNGELIEWSNDITICYADELISLMEEISDPGWPPLGSILMVLIACKENGKHLEMVEKDLNLSLLYLGEENDALDAKIQPYLAPTLRLLQIISELPTAYRFGKKRALLLKTIFADIPPIVNHHQTKLLLQFFYKHVFTHQEHTHTRLLAELKSLAAAAERIESKEALESMLRTGLERLPAPAPVDLTIPEPDLITQLTADRETAGIGHIAQRILATLHIPIHTQPDHDQSFGGISDISNKGSYDRLLLSELAQEDHLLMARIAHNEALYLKREALTSTPAKDKVMLIDASLKMWGKPRAVAIAAALACMQYDKKHTNVIAYTLKGNTAIPADLHHKKGVAAALSVLDNHLHSGEALESLLRKVKPGEADYYLITAEELMQQPAFFQAVVRQQAKLSCLITVNRNGQFRLYQYNKGRKKLCNAALLDLDELLFKSATKKPDAGNSSIKDIPDILLKQPLPLLYPASRLQRKVSRSYKLHEGVVCITSDKRILYWRSTSKGATELSPFLEEGSYSLGDDEQGHFYLLENNYSKDYCYLHVFTLADGTHTVHQTNVPAGLARMLYRDKYFHVEKRQERFSISCNDGTTGTPLSKEVFLQHYLAPEPISKKMENDVFRFVRKGYSTFSKIRSLYVDDNDHLLIGNWQLKLDHLQRMRLSDQSIKVDESKLRDFVTHTFTHPANPNIVFTRFEYPSGVIATADSRGFLHLQTANHSLPELLLTAIIDMQLTCWASDGRWTGNQYFIHDTASRHMWDQEFYQQYLQPYIALLKCP